MKLDYAVAPGNKMLNFSKPYKSGKMYFLFTDNVQFDLVQNMELEIISLIIWKVFWVEDTAVLLSLSVMFCNQASVAYFIGL